MVLPSTVAEASVSAKRGLSSTGWRATLAACSGNVTAAVPYTSSGVWNVTSTIEGSKEIGLECFAVAPIATFCPCATLVYDPIYACVVALAVQRLLTVSISGGR